MRRLQVKEFFQTVRQRFFRLEQRPYFYEIYVAIIALLILLGWQFSFVISFSILWVISAFLIVLTLDLKYVLPQIVFLIFSIGNGFHNDEIPVALIVLGCLYVVILAIPLFVRRLSLKKAKSWIGLAGLALMDLIPIFWCDTLRGVEIYYIYFVANIGYFLLYFFLVNGLGKGSLRIFVITMSYLGILLSLECGISVLQQMDTVDSIFDLWYYLGWGLCNEAGIMICFAMPFVFYLIFRSSNLKDLIFQCAKVFVLLIGLLLTTSRGSYLFGGLEFVILTAIGLGKAHRKKEFRIGVASLFLVGVLLFAIFHQSVIEEVRKMISTVFEGGLDDNGRVEIWMTAWEHFTKTPRNILFGPGACCEMTVRITGGGDQLTPLVFHSTLMETLAMGGIFGLICLGFHFFEKYRNLSKMNRLFVWVVGIGMVIVDLYGLIDNTYYMFYFMIPLMVMMATIDVSIDEEEGI